MIRSFLLLPAKAFEFVFGGFLSNFSVSQSKDIGGSFTIASALTGLISLLLSNLGYDVVMYGADINNVVIGITSLFIIIRHSLTK